MNELHQLSLAGLLDGVSRRTFSVRDVQESCRRRILAIDSRIGAFEEVSEQARSFKGLPIGIKDTFDVAGLQAERGSPIYRGRIATEDAACVARLAGAGIAPLGKTVTTEFAYFMPGKTVNPFDPRCTPGGSSSGSAAAVAACMVPAALGSQTAASVIRPASFCGVFAYVATRGRFPLRGVLPLAHSFDSLGLIARTARDLSLLHDMLLGFAGCGTDKPRLPRCLVAVDGQQFGPVEPDMTAAFETALEDLSRAGVEIRRCRNPAFGKSWINLHKKLMAREAADNFASELASHRSDLSQAFLALLDEGLAISPKEMSDLRSSLSAEWGHLTNVLSGCDAIIAPAAPGPAPAGLAATGQPHLSRPWQLFGLPQCTLPVTRTANGMPLGIQLIGKPHADAHLLYMSEGLEAMHGWSFVPPSAF